FATGQTITLSRGELGLTDTAGKTTIQGPSAGVTINAGNSSRVFAVGGGVTASFSKLTMTGGRASGAGPGLENGAGLINHGTLPLTDCPIAGNHADSEDGRGGGLYNDGTATLTNCTISNNSAGFHGAGVLNNGTATLINCTISGNKARNTGGGLFNYGTA